MVPLKIQRTVFKLSDSLGWQRDRTLILSPSFQRRPVWKTEAKSYLVDTIVRGLPVPVIFLRERLELSDQSTRREVVDGQQRLRSLISFIDHSAIPDAGPRDHFVVSPTHNQELAGKTFPKLPRSVQASILGYEFSTHVLPSSVEDREVLQIFARMNATGVKASPQELRNAEWFGVFKTLMYELAYEQLDRWRQWRVFTEDQIARMKEVEFVSDLFHSMLRGPTGKKQDALDDLYGKYNDAFSSAEGYAKQFRRTMDEIDSLIGTSIADSVFAKEPMLLTLYWLVYDLLFGLGHPPKRARPKSLPKSLSGHLRNANRRILDENVPPQVLDAFRRAAADPGRRLTRFEFLKKICHA